MLCVFLTIAPRLAFSLCNWRLLLKAQFLIGLFGTFSNFHFLDSPSPKARLRRLDRTNESAADEEVHEPTATNTARPWAEEPYCHPIPALTKKHGVSFPPIYKGSSRP